MKYSLECKYCGYKWNTNFKVSTCIKCDDKNIKCRTIETNNVFGYEEEEHDDMDCWNSSGD